MSAALLDEFLSVLRLPERVARLAPIADAPLVPSVDELLAMALNPKLSDGLGDLPRDGTAFAISMHAVEWAFSVAQTYEDEHGVPVPPHLIAQLQKRLDEEAWQRIYAAQGETDAE